MRTARLLRRGGVVAGPLFLATATIEGWRRTDYSALRHPISSLALGPRGPVQVLNFEVTGLLFAAAATTMPARSLRRLAFATTGAGLLVSGAFVTDPVSGYPAGTPAAPAVLTRAGAVHNASAVPVFLGMPMLQVVQAARFAYASDLRWSAYTAGTAAAMFGGFAEMALGFGQNPRWVPYGGAFQRISVVAGLGWLSALSLRSNPRSTATQPI